MIQKLDKPIYVTRPALPPLEEFTEYLQKIWDSKILTNNGPVHQKFEKELADYLGVKYVSLFSNGTLALMTAFQALHVAGEVITTPFSFVATTHALWWNNITPVFADVEPDHFTLDPDKVESAITSRTTAILPVHIYGYPCDVERLQKIAETHNLKLIYDAAHAFNVTIKDNSVLNFGDLSILSFHATKVFNTIEGGAIICHDAKTKERIDFLKNFGFADEVNIIGPGINGKMNEVQAAYGSLQLKYARDYITKRQKVTERYKELLRDVPGIHFLKDMAGVRYNYPYLPVLINAQAYGKSRDALYEELKKYNIFSRRYFYPLISRIPMYKDILSARPENLPVAEKAAQQVLCLPLYHDLADDEVAYICRIIRG